MMTGIIANPNLDEKDEKTKRLKDLEDHFRHAIDVVYGVAEADDKKVDFRKDPFFAAMRLPEGAGPLSELGKDIPTLDEVEAIGAAARAEKMVLGH